MIDRNTDRLDCHEATWCGLLDMKAASSKEDHNFRKLHKMMLYEIRTRLQSTQSCHGLVRFFLYLSSR